MRPMRFKGFMPRPSGLAATSTSPLRETSEFGPNPGDLRMFSYVPKGLAEEAPLVVILHGCTQDAASYDTGTGWTEMAERFGFAVLAPQQDNANSMRGCFNWFLPEDTRRGGGEAASIRQMIQVMADDYNIDTRRIFVTGLSAGGAMTGVMLATYPEVFAAGAIIAGLPYGVASNVQEALVAMHHVPARLPREWGNAVRAAADTRGRRPRVSVWHGDADHTVHPENAKAIEMQWRDVLSLDAQPSKTGTVNGYPYRAWQDEHGVTALESYTITGFGHGTPIQTGDSEEACGTSGGFILEAGISSTFRIAEFFGLAQATQQSFSARPNEARPVLRAVAGTVASTVKETIEAALRSAGLLK